MKKNPNKFKLICSVCKTEKSCNTNYKKSLMAKFGSEEEILASYICRTCVKKDSKTKTKRKKIVDGVVQEPKVYNVPIVQARPPRAPLTAEELSTKNTCWRPDIWFANKARFRGEGACNGCPVGQSNGEVCGYHKAKLFPGVDTSPLVDRTVYKKQRKKRTKKVS